MARIGVIEDITIDGSISVVTIQDEEIEHPVMVKAETRLFLNAITECYGENWKGARIEYDTDSIGCMVSFEPICSLNYTVLDD